MKSRSDRRPTETQIVDALHEAAGACGYDAEAECIAGALRELTPPEADDDARETLSAAVRRVWAERFALWGVA